jgi:hypothetical protein
MVPVALTGSYPRMPGGRLQESECFSASVKLRDPPPAGRSASADRDLLDDIRDHTDVGTVATITLAESAGTATLTVADDGPGMNPKEAAHAFERFWQAEATMGRPRRGAGLGLAIVAELVAAHRGTIALDTAPGYGTSFLTTLPTAAGEIMSDTLQPARISELRASSLVGRSGRGAA